MRINWISLFAISGVSASVLASTRFYQGEYSRDKTGVVQTVSTAGFVDHSGPFFKVLGTNGRTCATCHVESEAWTVTPEGVQQRFDETNGTDPIFRVVDGSNSPNADVSTVKKRRDAYSMLLSKAVLRIERPIPSGAEFSLVKVDDPYHYASAQGLSLFRRPLPSTNLRFISTVMWDGREVNPATPMTIANGSQTNSNILFDSLESQAEDATTGHAQATTPLTPTQQAEIVNFELGLSTAQTRDDLAGDLTLRGALGGPESIPMLPFYIGINDNVADPAGPFTPDSMTLFSAWSKVRNDYRAAIARGEVLFNTKPIVITGVNGLNNNAYFGSPASLTGTCTTCHNTPQVGDHSLAIALNIGIADGSRRTKDMPLYTLQNNSTGELLTTTDPGLALSTGKWTDIGRFKGPILRGLAARAPYFHNGMAKDFDAVLDFYTQRFGVQFTKRERSDLKAFLGSL